MKLGRLMIIVAICLATVSMAAAPAFAWDWPIFGFGPGAGAPLTNGPLPSTILPGTIEWAYQPGSAAQLVLPGYTYGRDAFSGNIGVGPVLSYGTLPSLFR